MLKKLALAAGTVLFAANLMAATPAKAPHMLLDTTNGQIEIELDPVKAPISTRASDPVPTPSQRSHARRTASSPSSSSIPMANPGLAATPMVRNGTITSRLS